MSDVYTTGRSEDLVSLLNSIVEDQLPSDWSENIELHLILDISVCKFVDNYLYDIPHFWSV